MLRKALDELREMEHKESGIPAEKTEGKDGAALAAAQACDEESDSTMSFGESEHGDTEALRKADQIAMDPAEYLA